MKSFKKRIILQDGERKVWKTKGDDRVCPICRPLDGVQKERGEKFTITYQNGNVREVYGPPAHRNCRCELEYV